MKTPVSQRRLEQITKRWQKRLRLEDWRISAKWATEAEFIEFFRQDEDEPNPVKAGRQAMAATDDFGPLAWNTAPTENREATVLLKVGQYESERAVESAVVHELLHIVLAFLTPASNDRAGQIQLERVVLTIEEALMGTEGE